LVVVVVVVTLWLFDPRWCFRWQTPCLIVKDYNNFQ